MPGFCSVCGSRSQSRRRLDGASVKLRHQLELYREISRQQAQGIDARAAECRWLDDTLKRRYAPASSSLTQAPPGKHEIDAIITKVRMEVERLQCEVGVWRGSSLGSAALAQGGDDSMERQEAANHELERKRWHAERSRLEMQLRDLKECGREFEAARNSGAEFVDLASVQAEAAYFRHELAAERSAASFSRERLAAVRLEVEEEKRTQARLAGQGEQALASTLQEIALTDRRVEVELELQRAQQAQLNSVQSTVLTLKAQVQVAQQEANELRGSLAQNQETLRRLRR